MAESWLKLVGLFWERPSRDCASQHHHSGCLCLHLCSWYSWELGCHGNSGVHLEEWDLSMEFVFCTPGCMQCMLLFSFSQGSFFSPAGCHCFEMSSTSPFTERRAGKGMLPVSFPFLHCGPGIQVPRRLELGFSFSITTWAACPLWGVAELQTDFRSAFGGADGILCEGEQHRSFPVQLLYCTAKQGEAT